MAAARKRFKHEYGVLQVHSANPGCLGMVRDLKFSIGKGANCTVCEMYCYHINLP